MLSLIWLSFFVCAFLYACLRAFAFGELQVFEAMTQACFAATKQAVETSLTLAGMLMFWMGLMKIAEAAGIVAWLHMRAQSLRCCAG